MLLEETLAFLVNLEGVGDGDRAENRQRQKGRLFPSRMNINIEFKAAYLPRHVYKKSIVITSGY